MTIRAWKIAVGFTVLFAAYQLPQALMLRWGRIDLFVAATLLFLPVAYGVARWIGSRGWSEYFLPLNRRVVLLVLGVPLGMTASFAGTWAGIRLGYTHVDRVEPWSAHVGYLLAVYGVSLISSLAEDILTRGFLLRHWPGLGLKWFVPLSALVYVLNHIYVLRRGPSLWMFLYVLGFALAWPLLKTRQMWLTVGAHWGWNIVYHTVNTLWMTTTVAPAAARYAMSIGSILLCLLLWPTTVCLRHLINRRTKA